MFRARAEIPSKTSSCKSALMQAAVFQSPSRERRPAHSTGGSSTEGLLHGELTSTSCCQVSPKELAHINVGLKADCLLKVKKPFQWPLHHHALDTDSTYTCYSTMQSKFCNFIKNKPFSRRHPKRDRRLCKNGAPTSGNYSMFKHPPLLAVNHASSNRDSSKNIKEDRYHCSGTGLSTISSNTRAKSQQETIPFL